MYWNFQYFQASKLHALSLNDHCPQRWKSRNIFFFWSKPDANIHLMQKIKSILALGCRNMSIVEVLYKNSIISLSVQPMMSFALCMLMAEYRRNMTVTQNSSSVWGQFLSSSNFYFLFLSPQEMESGIWYNACKLYPQTILSGSSAPAIKIC